MLFPIDLYIFLILLNSNNLPPSIYELLRFYSILVINPIAQNGDILSLKDSSHAVFGKALNSLIVGQESP
jgi:hypothetical protein